MLHLKKMGYITEGESGAVGAEYNDNRSGSYHPWSGQVIGESFGESGLKDFITLPEYMNTTSVYDEILKGVVIGAKRLAERNAAAAKAAAAKLKGTANEYSKEANDIMNKEDY